MSMCDRAICASGGAIASRQAHRGLSSRAHFEFRPLVRILAFFLRSGVFDAVSTSRRQAQNTRHIYAGGRRQACSLRDAARLLSDRGGTAGRRGMGEGASCAWKEYLMTALNVFDLVRLRGRTARRYRPGCGPPRVLAIIPAGRAVIRG